MNISQETIKGSIALVQVKLDLIKKGWIPLVSEIEQLPFDLVAFNPTTNAFVKIQIKYSSTKRARVNNTKRNPRNKKTFKYSEDEFECYALFLEEKNCVLYLPFSMGGKNISTEINRKGISFNWWEDFLDFDLTKTYKKKTCKDFNIEPIAYKNARFEKKLVSREGVEPSLEAF